MATEGQEFTPPSKTQVKALVEFMARKGIGDSAFGVTHLHDIEALDTTWAVKSGIQDCRSGADEFDTVLQLHQGDRVPPVAVYSERTFGRRNCDGLQLNRKQACDLEPGREDFASVLHAIRQQATLPGVREATETAVSRIRNIQG